MSESVQGWGGSMSREALTRPLLLPSTPQVSPCRQLESANGSRIPQPKTSCSRILQVGPAARHSWGKWVCARLGGRTKGQERKDLIVLLSVSVVPELSPAPGVGATGRSFMMSMPLSGCEGSAIPGGRSPGARQEGGFLEQVGWGKVLDGSGRMVLEQGHTGGGQSSRGR